MYLCIAVAQPLAALNAKARFKSPYIARIIEGLQNGVISLNSLGEAIPTAGRTPIQDRQARRNCPAWRLEGNRPDSPEISRRQLALRIDVALLSLGRTGSGSGSRLRVLSRGPNRPVRCHPSPPLGVPFRGRPRGLPPGLLHAGNRFCASPPWIGSEGKLRVHLTNGTRTLGVFDASQRKEFPLSEGNVPPKSPGERPALGPFWRSFRSIVASPAGGVLCKSFHERCLRKSLGFPQTPKPPRKPLSHGAATRPTLKKVVE